MFLMNKSDRKFDVVVVGELNVDIILNNIAGFPEIGKEIIADDLSVTLGSSSAIFASNLSTLGVDVAFIGKIGNDKFGETVISSLENSKVDTTQIIRSSKVNTGATIVMNYDQDRANVTYPGAMNDFCIRDVDFNLISNARHLHLSSFFMQPGIRNDIVLLFKKAKELGLTTSFDSQWDPEEKWNIPLESLLPYIDVFLPNSQEFKFITMSDSIEDGIKKIKNIAHLIVIKNGENGAFAWDGHDLIYQPAFINKNVIDCIGAGDSFNAGFVRDFIKGGSLKSCLKTAALAGAINTTMAGGTDAFKNPETTKKIAKEQFKSEI
jgi:sugar/nucleoside kinase (ribokinase family)